MTLVKKPKQNKKCKKCVIKNNLNFENYKICLEESELEK